MRFQYSLIIDISIIDKYLILKEMKETRLINKFSEKIIIWGNEPFWAQKLHILITQDPPEEFF